MAADNEACDSERPEPEGMLVPLVDVAALHQFIAEPFGSGLFKIRKSMQRNTYILDYYMDDGRRHGAAELFCWSDDMKKKDFILLYSSNITGSKAPFMTLFKTITGKMLGTEMLNPEKVIMPLECSDDEES
jgi:hypothetical protein